jgi:uncharacterized protein (UPF0210 family)
MLINPNEILETIRMVRMEHLDIRTVTMGISLRDCSHPDIEVFNENIYKKITSRAKELVRTTNEIQSLYGIPIINKRISVTPIAVVAESCKTPDLVSVAKTMDEAAKEAKVDLIGGFSALVHKVQLLET